MTLKELITALGNLFENLWNLLWIYPSKWVKLQNNKKTVKFVLTNPSIEIIRVSITQTWMKCRLKTKLCMLYIADPKKYSFTYTNSVFYKNAKNNCFLPLVLKQGNSKIEKALFFIISH